MLQFLEQFFGFYKKSNKNGKDSRNYEEVP